MQTLRAFPTDDATLEQLERACRTAIEIDTSGEYSRVGGPCTLQDILSVMSLGSTSCYSENDVILALINRIKELTLDDN